MSYDFAAAGSELSGTFTSTYTVPITLGCWIKYSDHPADNDYILTLHKDANLDEYITLKAESTADRLAARQADATSNAAALYTSGAGEYDGVWLPVVCTFESTTVWNIFVETISNTTERSGAALDPGAIGVISVGDAPNGAGHWVHKIAEIAIWDSELSNADITSYMGGTPASSIDAANLVGYWPLDADNATQSNEGADASGDLSVTNAVFDSDHPTIVSGNPWYYYAQQG